MKRCPRCGHDKPLSEFYRNRWRGPEARQNWCKACMAVRSAQWRAENPRAYRIIRQRADAKYYRRTRADNTDNQGQRTAP